MSKILTDKELQELLEDETTKVPDPKEAFLDTINPYKYIELDSNALAFDRIHRALNRNMKMTLIFGSPGTGKSMFLSRLNSDLLVGNKLSILISTPILDDEELFQTISFEIYKNSHDGIIPRGFNALSEAISKGGEFLFKAKPILLLDEAQLYSNATLEKIRILSDTENLRVIFAVHKLREENIFTKEHFKSRIWERIELINASESELKVYIQKKLMGISMLSLADQFNNGVVKIIHNITAGNYRVTNNLLYSYFMNYPQLYKFSYPNNKPLIIRRKELEVSAIQIGFLVPPNLGNTDLRYLPAVEQLWVNWRRKQLLKYFILLMSPVAIGYGIHSYLSLSPEEKGAIRSSFVNVNSNQDSAQNKINSNNKNINTDNNLSFPVIQYSNIIETEHNNSVNSLDNQALQLEPIDLSDPNQIELDLNEKQNNHENNQSYEDVKNSKLNIAIDSLGININNLIQIQTKNKIDGELPSVQDIKFKKDLDKKKIKFDKNLEINLGIELLQGYLQLKDYKNTWNIAIKLNEMDISLQEPYFIIHKILVKENLQDEAKKIVDACSECIFETQ